MSPFSFLFVFSTKMASYVALLSCFVVYFLGSVDGLTPSCTSVRTKYLAKGLLQSDVPAKAVSDSSLKVCPASSSGCCSKRMEDSFAGLAKTEYNVALTAKTDDIMSLFATNVKVFDDFFRELIKNSEKDLNTMFLKTYGIFYKQHSKVFIDLFLSLNQYYDGKNLDLTQVMNNFFASLMRQMFQLMNTKYKFEKTFLDCVTEHMDDLKPFGEEKQKLTVQVKRAFVAARAFVQGLNVGNSVLKQLQQITATDECEKQLTRLSYCSWCIGRTNLKPCMNFCTDTYKACFSNLKGVSTAWNGYVNAMLDLSSKFEGPFSIENVIDPIGVKISFAIMNFQEEHDNVAKKIFAGCGTPTAKNKKKRSSDSDFFIDEPGKVRRDVKQKDSSSATPGPVTSNLARITKTFKEQMKSAKDFWQKLPSNICASPKSSSDSANCWNGTAIGKYTTPADYQNNIDSSLSPSDEKIEQQLAVLKAMTQRLNAALSGEDVNVVGGDSDDSGDGSGSGSGESGDDNNIPKSPTVPPTTDRNSIDDDDNMLGGGVSDNGNTLGNRNGKNSGQELKVFSVLMVTMLSFVLSLTWL